MLKDIYKDISAFHPGYYVQEIIEDMGITQSEFAKRLNTTSKTLSKLLNGEIPLSNDLAENLSLMLGTSINVWINLQKKYEEKCSEIDKKRKIDKEKKFLKMLDYNYFVALKVVEPHEDENHRIIDLCTALKVSSLSILEQPDLLTACKTSILDVQTKNVVNANAWIQLGENIARNTNCSEYSKEKLKKILKELRGLTRENLSLAFSIIKEKLANCGIVLVALPYLKNSGLNGAVKWLTKDKVMLLINDRGKDTALFWFTLFHELKHVLQKKLKAVYLTTTKEHKNILTLGRNDEKEEQEANEFARDQLIDKRKYIKFVELRKFTFENIKRFANELNIAEEIVVGRLKYDGYLKWSEYPQLQCKYQFVIEG